MSGINKDIIDRINKVMNGHNLRLRRIPIHVPKLIWLFHFPHLLSHRQHGNNYQELPLNALLWKCMTRTEIIREMRKELSEHVPSIAKKMELIEQWIKNGDPWKNKMFLKNYAIFREWRITQLRMKSEKFLRDNGLTMEMISDDE